MVESTQSSRGLLAQRVADRALGLPDAVERRGIDIAHPGLPGGRHDRLGRLPRHIDPAAAQGCAAETQLGHLTPVRPICRLGNPTIIRPPDARAKTYSSRAYLTGGQGIR